MNGQIDEYFRSLKAQANVEYDIAKKARSFGKDCNTNVEIPQAEDLAGRVEALTGIEASGIIKELTTKYDRERVAIEAAISVSENFDGNEEEKIEKGIRVALAILTEGILVAPLEGITGVKIKSRNGSNYLAIYYSGPIRSAGGTAQALSVFIGDLLRRKHGIGKYEPSVEEIERCKEEIPLYARVQHLQYVPTLQEIETAVRGSPVCITGEGTEETEVAGHRDLADIETNRIRGGMALVIAEGLILKASKLRKYVNTFGVEGWSIATEKVEQKDISPNPNYLKEAIAGRPALSYPSRKGGFRLRYGRSRNTGLAAVAINPITMKILDDFIAIGTQIKMERPGKAGAVVANDNLEGPTVLTDDDSLVKLTDETKLKKYGDRIKEIVDLGEIMVSFGEFIENNKVIFPGAFTRDWWEKICMKSAGFIPRITNEREAIEASLKYNIPLHPDFTYLWHDVSVEEAKIFAQNLEKDGTIKDDVLEIPPEEFNLRFLQDILCEYTVNTNLKIKQFLSLITPLGLEQIGNKLVKKREIEGDKTINALSNAAGFKIYQKGPSRIGARMGRPEKAEERSMNPPVHVLYPIGTIVKNRRDLTSYEKLVRVEMRSRRCPSCGELTHLNICNKCSVHTEKLDRTMKVDVNIAQELRIKSSELGVDLPDKINGVKGLTSTFRTPEPLEKGILRSYYSVYPFKDGTCRFDMSDLPLTHVRLDEIGLTVNDAVKLGYELDYMGKPLENENQIIELLPQDIVPSKKAGEYLVNVSKFIDSLLERVYHLEPYYMAKTKEDLIGELIIGLAPHTSGGILGRIVGYTEGEVCYAHPFFHASKRRNCDGDEDSIMLLLDGLINFSRDFLPDSRGSLMDAPLVLSLKINPTEIDKEALNLDITGSYPLELLEKTLNYPDPSDIQKFVITVGNMVKSGDMYPRCSFTDDTSSINEGTLTSSYKSIDSMELKLDKQFELARKIRAVDESDFAERILRYHFIPDIMGNLNKFGSQSFRCTTCNQIFRRPTLSGNCPKCGTPLIGTVHKGNVTKYLEKSYSITKEFEVSEYVRQRIFVLRESVNSIFQERNNSMKTLEDFNDT